LLTRTEHNENKTKTETEIKIETVMRPRPITTRARPRLVYSIARKSKTIRYALFLLHILNNKGRAGLETDNPG